MKVYVNVNQLVIISTILGIAISLTVSAALKANRTHARTVDILADDIYKLSRGFKGDR